MSTRTQRRQKLNNAPSDPATDLARLRAAALGTSAGYAAWPNAVAAVATTAVLSLPWATSLWGQTGTVYLEGLPALLTVVLSTVAVWAAFGFLYGSMYPWIRERDPVAKAELPAAPSTAGEFGPDTFRMIGRLQPQPRLRLPVSLVDLRLPEKPALSVGPHEEMNRLPIA